MPIFDSISEVYDETRYLPPEIMGPAIEAIVSAARKGTSMLDVGIGTGRFAVPLCGSGLDVTGIDISTRMMERCRQKGFEGKMVMASAESMPFPDSSFDNALMVHVLHLMNDWQAALTDVCRVTRNSLMSVVSAWPETDWPGDYYSARVDELGYGPAQPGKTERELGRLLAPDRIIPIGKYVRHRDNDGYIDLLEQRKYSSATKLPDDLHAMVVAEARERYGGGSQDVDCTVEVHIWDTMNLSKSLLNIGH